MTTSPFNGGWEFSRQGGSEFAPVTLPHGAMIAEPRRPDADSWAHGGYFAGGWYRYRKVWTPTADLADKQVSLRFEGVYRHSTVLLDGREVGGAIGGYREFEVRLDPHIQPGETHTIDVVVDNRETPSARWYTGSGIYRPVWLEVRDRVHVAPGGVTLITELHGSAALVDVVTRIGNDYHEVVKAEVTLRRAGKIVGTASGTTSGDSIGVALVVDEPELWSAESPRLHELEVVLTVDGDERDRTARQVGLRSLRLQPGTGLLVNGRPVNLRGANIHHDNGVVGAATFSGSERRRVRILKETGFNAIRSAHNPASRALLEACDELGMYVMDEAYDGWFDHKTVNDDADHFDATWRDELASMVGKDRMSPSVILYSIGNENGEAFSPRGRRVTADMVAELKRLDPSRPVTLGVNMVGAAFAGLGNGYAKELDDTAAKPAPDMTSTALNVISNRFGLLMKRFPRLRAADRSTRELLDLVDVAGYNYGTARYRLDAALHPERLVVGTETMPGDLARNWALVEELPSVIGDFVWAGWDYIGEAGGGTWAYGRRAAPFLKAYPQLVSGMGIIDITGVPGAAVLLARAAWGMLTVPAIAVRPLDVTPGPVSKTSWRSTDAIQSWSWTGHEGERTDLEIYSADDEVEVLINGRSLGRHPAGPEHEFLTRFRTRYEPGVVEAIGYRDGREVSRSALRTSEDSQLRLVAEGELGHDALDVAYLRIEVADDAGTVDSTATGAVTVRIDGPATLAGFGSGAPATEESFVDDEHTTYRGRALAVIRSTGEVGTVTVTASSRSYGTSTHVFENTLERTAP
jgi:beta-galactosidase